MSVKRARSASEEFSIYLTDADAAPPVSTSTLNPAQLQAQAAATAVLPGPGGGTEASFKSARTRNHTSPTARSPLHQQQQQQQQQHLLYSNTNKNPLPSERIDMATPTSGSGKSHLAVASSTSGTPALSSSSQSSNHASPMSPPHSAEALDARVFGGFGDLYQSSASPQPSTSLHSKPTPPTQAYGSSWQQRQAQPWSTYTSPMGFSHATSPYAGPHSGGSGSSYRGSMDDTLGFGAGYGVPPSTALAGLGFDGSSPLGFPPSASTSATTPSTSAGPPPTTTSIGGTMFGLDPAAAAALPPPPQQPLPAPPTTPQVAQQAYRPGPHLQQQQQSQQQSHPQQWRTMSPLSFGFRETRKGQDLGLGLEDLEVIETLGTGTFGRVLLCRLLRSPGLNMPQYFAMKVLSKHEVVRLKQIQHINSERSILTAVRQNGIVNLFCTFQDERNLYLLMDFIQGGELFSHLRRAGRFSADVARFYAANILLTIEYMHGKDIIYRDLKPENLLLDHQGYLKITDFGFAKYVPDRTFTLCGTPEYLAPEIIQSTGHGKAADYWALGVLLFEMMCGYPCFWADNPLGIYEKILSGKFYFPDHIDPVARDLIRRLLSSNLSKRLGNLRGGVRDIMDHPWFAGVDWDMVRRREIMAPIVPRARSPGDCSHFEKYGHFSLDSLPAMARAANKRAHLAAGTWIEPNEAEKEQMRQQQAREDHYGELFTDF